MSPLDQRRIQYIAPPILAAFHKSMAFVRGVMGPVGSGKSSAMCMELLTRAVRQHPDAHGVRKSRMAIVRNTYPELKTTTLKTWADWVPEDLCPVSRTAPMRGMLRLDLEDGTRTESELLFLALDRPADVKKLLSLELTGAWVNEAREIPKAVVDGLTGRVGRYPAKRFGGPTWSGVIMDTNPPDEDHWWYRLAEEERPDDWVFFRQPPALVEKGGRYCLSPQAENVAAQPLGGEYWLRQVAGKGREWINVYLLGRYGLSLDGRPVYPEYDDVLHLAAKALEPLTGVPLVLGWDFGLTPACVVCQVTPQGRFLVLAEFLAQSMGIRRFAREVVGPALRRRFEGLPVRSFGDPAGTARAQTDERTCFQELAAAGLCTQPARSNDFTARRESVAGFLSATRDGRPVFSLSPVCTLLRKGFLSGYRYERLAVAMAPGEERYASKPLKNRYSHLHDALQYAALGVEDQPLRSFCRAKGAHRPADAMAGY